MTPAPAPAWNSGDGFHGQQTPLYEEQSFNDSSYNHYHHSGGHFNGGAGFGSGQQGPGFGRKRPWNHQYQDHNNPSHAKLYVANIPRTALEQDIRPLFEQFGNIIEVVMLKDKRTGLQQGKCFVKYATSIEADKAIAALNNLYTFPGEVVPITVKFAEGERERLGVRDKVFVAMLNKEASAQEIEEIFSPYGVIEDIYIVRDEMMQSRGCGFVKFSHTEMAIAAINGLNGNFVMRGCDHPVVVRFAEPKKPKSGEFRNNHMFNGSKFGPNHQEFGLRPTNNVDSGYNHPNTQHPLQHFSSTSQAQATSLAYNQEPFSQMPLQHMHNSEPNSQSFRAAPELPKQSHPMQPRQMIEQQKWPQTNGHQPQPSGTNFQAVSINLPVKAATVPENPQTSDRPECDWSEHTCPDGYKYYYNCVTRESLWLKPKEFALFEEQVKKQRQQRSPHQQDRSSSQSHSPVAVTQETRNQNGCSPREIPT